MISKYTLLLLPASTAGVCCFIAHVPIGVLVFIQNVRNLTSLPWGRGSPFQTSLTPGLCIEKNGLATIIASHVFWVLLGVYLILMFRAITRRQWNAPALRARVNVSVLAVSTVMTRIVVYRPQKTSSCDYYRYHRSDYDVFWFL